MTIAMIFNFWICDYAITEVQAASLSTSQEGINLLKTVEGCVLTAYKPYNSEAYYTIGYGHFGSDVYAGMTITQAQAEEMLKNDLKKYEGFVNNFLNKYGVNITQNQFDALVSFTYNLGNVWGSTFDLKTIIINGANNYSSEDIVAAFTEWRIASGQVSQGLINRRKKEAALFLKDRGYIPERNLYVTSPYMTGNDVTWVQESLCKLGYTVDVDGIYGNDTANKVKQFQSDNELTVDGICGDDTRNKMKEKTTTHTHKYTEYIYCWKDHPHYKCYRCSCGDIKENRNEPTYVDTCAECNKQNNNVDNLEWCTFSHNAQHSVNILKNNPKKWKSKKVAQKSLDGKIIKIWDSAWEIQRILGFCQVSISRCCRREKKGGCMYGYLWDFA